MTTVSQAVAVYEHLLTESDAHQSVLFANRLTRWLAIASPHARARYYAAIASRRLVRTTETARRLLSDAPCSQTDVSRGGRMEGLSLRPSDAQAGGFLDDADVLLQELRFVLWDYQGKAPMSVALKVVMIDQSDDRAHEQYYSAGDPAKFAPSADGKALTSLTGTASGLNSSTNALAFLTSLVNAGFPEDKIGNDVSLFDGTLVHVDQIAQPKRAGLKDQRDKTYLLVSKILRLPWDSQPAKPAKGAPSAAARPTPVPAAAPAPATPAGDTNGHLVTKALNAVLTILVEKGGALPKGQLSMEAYRTLGNDPDRNAVVKLVHDEKFLQECAAEKAFAYDGTTVSLA